jgi:hypothetical protein
MRSWVMLAETAGFVEGTLAPWNVELSLSDPVARPAESHAHCVGPLLFDEIVGNASCHVVVSFNDGRGLWVAHFLQHCSDRAGFFAVVEKSAKFCLGCAGDNLPHDGTKNFDGSIERRGLLLKLVRVGAETMVTRCPRAGLGFREAGSVAVDV